MGTTKQRRVTGLLRGARSFGMRMQDFSIYPKRLKVGRVLARPEVATKVLEFKRGFAKQPVETLLRMIWGIYEAKGVPKVLKDEAYSAYTYLAANLKSARDAEFVAQVLAEAKALGYLQ